MVRLVKKDSADKSLGKQKKDNRSASGVFSGNANGLGQSLKKLVNAAAAETLCPPFLGPSFRIEKVGGRKKHRQTVFKEKNYTQS